ncbi:MAG TPA: bifunctional 5,10-methylenetetrahydrofolate dehydrogenase/5,10-methenyltetrahydrofolate cyclohydrolase [Bacteroidales bacterium]|nr:bifunctional 5,10-methylenetetrahydrofolate dehydrogenase/5,10-methenyltetrahydrofolate cyclohydrolase [Bacteroidales bacterium]HRZ20754.1 bifunctional 5,10-methylenetetrahydrofolate dehydrogenase/5,10-methenyltetrahydrofolate cyclohydrolase [Bacteroidales bacterium]
MELIDGKKVAEEMRADIARQVAKCIDEDGTAPHLAAILVGDDPPSQTYVRNKEKACQEVGFISSVYKYPSSFAESELLKVVDFINKDNDIHGLIVQLPLPGHIHAEKIIRAIDPAKDVDGFHPVNVGNMVQGLPSYLPATPFGILRLLEYYSIETDGKHCVVLGRSNIVGTPVSILLSRKSYPGNCTVTLCHSKTRDLASICRQADILIAAIGQPHFVKADMVREGAVVIDVGIHRIPDASKTSGYQLTGDVDFPEVSKKAGYITPVPGGVGPMTIVALLSNTLKAFKKEIYP